MPLFRAIALFVCLISLVSPAGSALAPAVRVLLIEGASNHDWEGRIGAFEAILSQDGSFELDVAIVPQEEATEDWQSWLPDFESYDVILSGYSDAAGGAGWPEPAKSAFVSYVSGGGGFVAFHEANQAFTDWQEFQNIIGLAWHAASVGTAFTINPDDSITSHPPGSGLSTGHGARADSLVKRHGLPVEHPIHAGLPPTWMAADLEVVRFPRGTGPNVTQNVTILSYAEDPDPPAGQPALQHPVEWTSSYGAGRVYASTYGHVWVNQEAPIGLRCAAFQETLVRALKWCAGTSPGSIAPSDFPTPTAPSIRTYSEGYAGFGGAQAVAPFANGALPTLSIVPTEVDTLPAFPNLSWESPIDARPWPGTPGEIMVTEMDGRLFRLPDDDAAVPADVSMVLDIRDRAWYMNWDVGANTHKHGGIMSCALHPQFGQNAGKDYVYIYYLHHPGDDPNAIIDGNNPYFERLSRFTWNGSSNTFDPASELIMIQQWDTVKGHDGGGLAFGGDGYLYLTVGDEGTASQQSTPHTQKIDDRFRSGVWRLDVDQRGAPFSQPIVNQPAEPPLHSGESTVDDIDDSFTQGYYIPSDNPWVNVTGALGEFYAIGLREPHRMTYDPVGDRFWIGDVGAGTWEEVDVMDAPGLNFQWNYQEGNDEGFRDPPVPLIGTEQGPVHQYGRDVGTCIIGGYVYRGTAIPELDGKYIFGDNTTQFYYALEYDPATKSAVSVERIGQGRAGTIWNGIGSFGIDSQGEMLLLQMGAGTSGGGQISRIARAGTASGESWEYPELFSQTGLFTDLATLEPAPGLVPYEVNMPLWSSGLTKKRWVMVPSDGYPNTPTEQITYSENGNWKFPVGTVFVKHFALPNTGAPLETRLWVHGTDGWGGVSYRWRPGEAEADLVEDGLVETLTLNGEVTDYLYPSRTQCAQCHQPGNGSVLGFRTRQLNRFVTYPNGRTAHQIESFSAAGFIADLLKSEDLADVITSADVADNSVSDEKFVRSYLDSNCAHCHQPAGSSRAFFDARLTTPLTNQSLICGPLIEGLGLPAPAVIKPGSLGNSALFQRISSHDSAIMMPPIARGPVDDEAVARIANWILSMEADSCTKSQSFYGGDTLGITGAPMGNTGSDPWMANIVIHKESLYTNSGPTPVTLIIDEFQFHASSEGDPLTPFVVRIDGNNSFTVLAIGEPRSGYPTGENVVDFSDTPGSITLSPGESIAPGFIDSFPDGSGGSRPESVSWTEGGLNVWHGGGLAESDAGSVAIGSAPDPGSNLETTQLRDYHFAVTYIEDSLAIGNPPNTPGFRQTDGANSNFVVNLSEGFTNTTGGPLIIGVERFRFHAGAIADPVTPLLVRVNGPDDFTALAVGEPRDNYSLGGNDFPFSTSPQTFQLAPGETIAPAFLDSLPDGTPGDQAGTVTYIDGGDNISYYYDIEHAGAVVEQGQPLSIPFPYTLPPNSLFRDYLFAIKFQIGSLLGLPGTPEGGAGSDAWLSNMVIQKDAIYTNLEANPVTLQLDRFTFHAASDGDPVTPFVVRVDGADSFSVLAIGESRSDYGEGSNTFPFADAPATVTLAPGESIAPGFIDSYPDGSGGSRAASVSWIGGNTPIWHGGGPLDSDAGSLAIGSPPDPGSMLAPSQLRDYHFSVSYLVSALHLGNDLAQPGFLQVDGARSNFVINLSETFTNLTAETLTISVERFRFHAFRVTDPLTPFIVRLNATDDYTVIAIGDAQAGYTAGENDLPFSASPPTISVAPGETIATGFLDNAPDGTPGSQAGAIAFIDGGDSLAYRYSDMDEGGILELGQPPIIPFPYPFGSEVFRRDYLFAITLGFGGKEDEDDDGLRDSWELAFTSSLETLSSGGDHDGDGMTDHEESIAGTDPTDASSLLQTLSVAPDSEGATATVQTVPGRDYSVRVSADLRTWINVGTFTAADWPEATTPVLIPSASLPAGADRGLYIRVSRPGGSP